MGKCPKCGKKTTSWLELEYCDRCYSEDDLDSYKLLDEIEWLKQKIFRTQYDCDQCQARHIKDKDDLESTLEQKVVLEKALELACENAYWYVLEYYVGGDKRPTKEEYIEKSIKRFIKEAKEIMKSE